MAVIVVFCDRFPVLSETFVTNEIAALRRLGHEVTVVAGEPGDAVDPTVTVLTRSSVASALRVAIRHPLKVLGDRLARRRWAREESPRRLRELAPAILAVPPGAHLHAHFAAGAALDALRVARITGRTYSVTAHAYDIYLLPRNLREKLERAAFATSGCAYTVDNLRRLAPGARVEEVVMGVDPDVFARTTPYPAAGPVVAVGRLEEKKGFVHLVRAAASADLGLVIIVGEGSERAALEAEIAATGAPVELRGAQSPAAIRALLEEASVLAMPCVVAADGNRDSMPVVVKEAMAMEVPVVVSDEVGLPELVTPACGRLVAPGDPAALAAALAEVLALPHADRAALGRAGRARVTEVADLMTETARLAALITPAGSPSAAP